MAFLAALSVVSLLAKSFIGGGFDSGLSYGHTLDRQGRVLTVPWKSGVGPVGKITDLQGKVPPDLEGRRVDRNLLEEIEAPMTGIDWPVHQSYRNPGRFYVQYFNATTPGSEVWYYSPEQGRLLGYDDNFHQFLGSFGPDGFVPAGEESRARFDGELHYLTRLWDAFPPEFLVFPRGVYAVDFSRRAIRALFTPLAGETVRGASRWKDRRENRSLAVVSTSTSIHLLTSNGEPVISVRRSFEPDTYGNVSVGRLDSPERYVVWYAPSRWLDPDVRGGMPDYLLEYDSAGREIARQTVPPRPQAASSPAQALFGLATPLTEAAVLVGSARQMREQSRMSGGMQAWVLCDFLEMWISSFLPRPAYSMDTSSGLFLGFAALSLLSSAACALVCLLLAGRYSFSRARCVGWALCGFLFGLVGLLAMLALQEWPARIACPSCRKPRRVDRDRCEHCGAAQDPPATDGTEIFETSIPNSAAVRDLGLTGMLQ